MDLLVMILGIISGLVMLASVCMFDGLEERVSDISYIKDSEERELEEFYRDYPKGCPKEE